MPTDEILHRVKPVAERLDCGTELVYRLVATGQLRAVRVGRFVRIPESAVQEFIAHGGATLSESVAS